MDSDINSLRKSTPDSHQDTDGPGNIPKLPIHAKINLPPPDSASKTADKRADLESMHAHMRQMEAGSKRAVLTQGEALKRWTEARKAPMPGAASTAFSGDISLSANQGVIPLPLNVSSTAPSPSPSPSGSGGGASTNQLETADSDVSVEVDTEDEIESDDDSTDSEFGKKDNPKMEVKTRTDLERLIFAGKENTTLKYKEAWEKAKKREDHDAKTHRGRKYAWDMAAGSANQLTSFAVGGIAASLTGQPWVFPVVATVASDLIGERLAQVIRKSTIVTKATRENFENQRRLARGLGDLVADCAQHPKRKFDVTVGADDEGKPVKKKMSACEALAHSGCRHGFSAWGQNLLVRGLPFLWFSAIYIARDYYLNFRCPDSFYPSPVNSTEFEASNYTHELASGCPDPEAIDPVALRWGMILLGGMLAGGMTSVTNQLIASCMPGDESTNYSADTRKLQVTYLESARVDTKLFLDNLASKAFVEELGIEKDELQDLLKASETLKRIQEKELSIARKKSSAWTTFQAELDLATQKHRDETMITPEFGGKRLELFLSMLGKFLSLLAYAYVLSNHDVRKAESEREKVEALVLIPISLIVLGYIWRDDLRLVGHLPYGAVKGALRARREKQQEGLDTTTRPDAAKASGDPEEESSGSESSIVT